MTSRKFRKRQIAFLLTFIIALCVFITSAVVIYYQNIFTYSNLADDDSQLLVQALLRDNGIPQENIDLLLSQINTFYSTPYKGITEEGWENGSIPFFSYRDKDGFAHMDTQPEIRVNCRMTAFVLLKDQVVFEETALSPAEEKDTMSRTVLTDELDLRHYDLLFSNLEDSIVDSSEAMAERVGEYWKNSGIRFMNSNVKFIMAYGSSGQLTQNFHTAVAIYGDDCVWLLEKYDPIHPYQLSRFESEEKMIRYMAKRVYDVEYAAVFSNDTCLWVK